MIRKKPAPHLMRVGVPVFPRDKREAFAREIMLKQKIERDDDSKKGSSRSSAVALSRSGTVSRRYLSGSRIGKRARLATREATLRCGEPMQLQLWVRILTCNRARGSPLRAGAMGVLQLAR